MKLKTIKDYDLNNKRVIIRLDLNVPMENGQITDDTKIKESLETIEYAYQHNAKVILMSHLGRVKEEKDKLTSSLEPVSKKLSKLLNKEVKFSKETSGANLKNMVDNMNNGEILLIENTRFEDIDNKKESSCNLELSKYWASLGDIFINDAYGSAHRAHASNVGIANLLPNGIGFLVEKELTKINTFLKEDTHPYIVIMGGKKVEDKIKIIENLITKCDKLIIGGAMSYTFLKVKGYNVENNIIDENSIDFCHSMLNKYKDKIVLPIDVTTENGQNISLENLNGQIGFDIGIKSQELFKETLTNAKRVIINGPLGMFEKKPFDQGTKSIYQFLIDNNIKTIIGGGDTAASAVALGFKDKFYHISTGGGATLEYLEGKTLPGISVINNE